MQISLARAKYPAQVYTLHLSGARVEDQNNDPIKGGNIYCLYPNSPFLALLVFAFIHYNLIYVQVIKNNNDNDDNDGDNNNKDDDNNDNDDDDNNNDDNTPQLT